MDLNLLSRNCPLCSCSEWKLFAEANLRTSDLTNSAFASRKVPEFMHPRMVRCVRCQLLYANPAPDASLLKAAYTEAAFDSQVESQLAAHTYRDLVARKVADIDVQAALDIGAGDGAFLEQLVALGIPNVSGVEPSQAPLMAARPSVRALIRNDVFQAKDYLPQSFDLVTCFQVLEHVPSPLQLSRDVFQLLRPGGLFIIVVHNSKAISARVLKTKSPIFDIEHLQLFDLQTSVKLLAEAGFVSGRAAPIWNSYPLAYWLRLAPLSDTLKSKLLNLLNASRLGEIKVSIPPGNLVAWGVKPNE